MPPMQGVSEPVSTNAKGRFTVKRQAPKIIARCYVCGKLIYEGQRFECIGGRLYRHKHAIKKILDANLHDRAA